VVDESDVLNDAQSGAHGTHGVVFLGNGVTEVRHDAIAQELGNMAFVTADGVLAYTPIRGEQIVEVFRIEAFGERGGVDHVTEEERELPALAFAGTGVDDDLATGGAESRALLYEGTAPSARLARVHGFSRRTPVQRSRWVERQDCRAISNPRLAFARHPKPSDFTQALSVCSSSERTSLGFPCTRVL
jgi:hypothetical protein